MTPLALEPRKRFVSASLQQPRRRNTTLQRSPRLWIRRLTRSRGRRGPTRTGPIPPARPPVHHHRKESKPDLPVFLCIAATAHSGRRCSACRPACPRLPAPPRRPPTLAVAASIPSAKPTVRERAALNVSDG
jgi:hypothetical protein